MCGHSSCQSRVSRFAHHLPRFCDTLREWMGDASGVRRSIEGYVLLAGYAVTPPPGLDVLPVLASSGYDVETEGLSINHQRWVVHGRATCSVRWDQRPSPTHAKMPGFCDQRETFWTVDLFASFPPN